MTYIFICFIHMLWITIDICFFDSYQLSNGYLRSSLTISWQLCIMHSTRFFGKVLTRVLYSRIILIRIFPSGRGYWRLHMLKGFSRLSPTCRAGSQSSLTRSVLKDRIKVYGFIQCGQIYSFLDYVCDSNPGEAELKYVQGKLVECLMEHDDGGIYFSGLKSLLHEVNYALGHCLSVKDS